METLGSNAYGNCIGLMEVMIPVALPGFCAFKGCVNVRRIHYTAQDSGLMADRVYSGSGTQNSYYNTLEYACRSSLQSVDFESGVKRIGAYTYYAATEGNAVLTTVTLPDTLESIGKYAFYNCYALTELVFPNAMTTLGVNAFYGCTGVSEITFLGDLPQTSGTVFGSVTADAWRFTLADSWANAAAPNLGGTLTWHAIEDTLTQRLSLPSALSVIEDEAFLGVAADMAVVPDGVAAIGTKAFGDSASLRAVLLPGGEIDIAPDAFSGSDVVLFAPSGSAAEQFARANGVAFLASDWQGRLN